MRIAIGIESPTQLSSGHFGDSPFYHILEVQADGRPRHTENRPNPGFTERQHGDPNKAKNIKQLLDDVDVLVARKVGPNIGRMSQHFVILLTQEAMLDNVTEQLQRNGLLATAQNAINNDGRKVLKF